MAGFENYDCDGTLTINSVSMNRPAWMVAGDESGAGGLIALWFEFDLKGEDRSIASAAGVIPYQRRYTATRFDLRMLITGDVNSSGVASNNPLYTLQGNIDYLMTNVLAPTGTGDGTRAATITMPAGGTRSADIHVLGLKHQRSMQSDTQAIVEATLQISIPAGRFA